MRPVPYSSHLASLARRIQKTQRAAVKMPTLLASQHKGRLSVISGAEDANLHLFDAEKGRIVLDLPLPNGSMSGSDFRLFSFNADFQAIAAYDKSESIFAVWSLEDGKILNAITGQGKIPPALTFLPGKRIAVADSRRIAIHRLGGDEESVSFVSEDLRSLVLYSPREDPSLLVAVGAFRKGDLGHLISAFHMRSGRIVAGREGPYRPKPEDRHQRRRIYLHECPTLPGRKGDVLIVLEEDCLRTRDPDTGAIQHEEFSSRLVPVEPTSCQFLDDGLKFPGQFCLEYDDDALLLIDELGRRRQVTGFPLKAKPVDWRLEG